jgi:hypothetical protein
MASFIHRTFSDPDAYGGAIRLANANGFSVSERGIFNATLDAIDLGGVWLQRGSDTLARTVNIELKDARRPRWMAPAFGNYSGLRHLDAKV